MTDQEHRGTQRKRVLKGAVMAFNGRSSTMSCTVRDLSDTGARLRVAPGQAIPSRFDLIVESEGIDVPCTVAWRKGEEIGVSFDEPLKRKAAVRAQTMAPITAKPASSLLRKPLK